MTLRNEWTQSLIIHLAIALFAAIWIVVPSLSLPHQKPVKIEIHEVVKQTTKPEIKMNAPPPPKAAPVKRVFGLNNKTLTSTKSEAVEVKSGNTIAKDIDNEKMDPKDAEALPVPAEEYLVTQMPKLKREVRIPYPAEAKAKNLEGAVVMDVLIDDEGHVRSAKLIEGPGLGLNEAAMKAIYDFEFAPAMIEGKPVAVRIRYAYKFVLR